MREADIQRGFESVAWQGRFEVIHENPIIVVDSAHNRDSALKLRLALDDYFPARPVVLVFGASEDKDVEGMFSELMPRVRQVIATKSIHPRSMDP
jgi:dihydrofolate synthase/folylpolyglutamate synthase